MNRLWSTTESAVLSDKVTVLVQAALIIIAYASFFWRVIPDLMHDWYEHPSLSYGFFVPMIAAYLVWQQKHALTRIVVASSLHGCLLLCGAMTLFLVGQLAADTFVMRVAMLLALVGLIQYVLGNYFLTALWFPLFYLVLMIPPPYALVKRLVNFLMFFDAALASKALQLFEVPVYLELNFLHLPNITLEVADVCSGISSIFVLFVLGVIYAYLLPIPARLKVLLAATSVPLAVFANLVRIIITVALTYYWGPVVLNSIFHTFQGTFNFVLCFLLLILMGEALRRRYGTSAAEPRNSAPSLRSTEHGKTTLKLPVGSAPVKTTWNTVTVAVAILASGGWISAALQARGQTAHYFDLERLPLSFGAYTALKEALPDPYIDRQAGGALSRLYGKDGGTPIELFIGYQANDAGGNRLQSPMLMFPERWNYIWIMPAQLTVSGVEVIQANWMLTQRGPAKRLVLYWYQARTETFAGELYYRVALLKGRLLDGRSDMSVIRMSTRLEDNENLSSAQERLKELAVLVQPELTRLTEHNAGKTNT